MKFDEASRPQPPESMRRAGGSSIRRPRAWLAACLLPLCWVGPAERGWADTFISNITGVPIADWYTVGTWTDNGGATTSFPGGADTVEIDNASSTTTQLTEMASVSALSVNTGELAIKSTGQLTVRDSLSVTGSLSVEGRLVIGANGTVIGQPIIARGEASLDLNSGASVTAGLALDTAANDPFSIEVDAGNAATVSGVVSDDISGNPGVLAKTGAGTLILAGTNTYSGGTMLKAGTIRIENDAALGTGALTFGGAGTVLQCDNFMYVHNAIVLTSDGTVDVKESDELDLFGQLTGSGGLIKTGSGNLGLWTSETYTGLTTIQEGALVLITSSPGNAGAIASSSGVAVAGGATFDISYLITPVSIQSLSGAGTVALGFNDLSVSPSGVSLFSGVLKDGGYNGHTGGSLTMAGTGTLVLTGANTYTGSTTVRSGTLQLGDGTAASDAAALGGGAVAVSGTLAFAPSATAAYAVANTLTGSGAIDQIGAGATVLSGDASGYDGTVAVSAGTLDVTGTLGAASGIQAHVTGGTLQVDGTLNAGNVSLTGGTLRGTGTIHGNVALGGPSAAGMLAAGTATQTGTLTINGNLALDSGSTVSLRVNGAGDHDAVHVTGTAAVQSGANLLLTMGGNMNVGDHFSLLTADGGLSGANNFNVVNSLGNAVLFTTSTDLGLDGPTVVVTATQGSFLPFAANGNEAAVARVLDGARNDPRMHDLIQALDHRSGSEYGSDFTRLSPIQEATVTQASIQASHAAFNTLGSRMDAIRMGSSGLSLSQFNWLDQNIPGSALIAGTDIPTGIKAFTPAPDNRWGFFAAANGNFGDIDGQTSQSNYYGGGFTVGSDYRIDQSFAVGFAAGYDYSKTDFDHSGSDSVADSIRFGPYATWKDEAGDWVEGTVGGAVHFYDSNRDAFGGTASSSTTGVEFDGSLKCGHDFHLKPWTLTPTFGFDYLHLDIGKYSETGSLAPLTIQDQRIDSFRGNLGGTVAYAFQWKGIGWNPYVQAGWAHEFLDASQSVNARFASGAGDTFSTAGDNLGRDSATFGAGLQADLTETVTANLSYSGEANDRYQDHSFNAALRVQF